jgi:hypothetical protein
MRKFPDIPSTYTINTFAQTEALNTAAPEKEGRHE